MIRLKEDASGDYALELKDCITSKDYRITLTSTELDELSAEIQKLRFMPELMENLELVNGFDVERIKNDKPLMREIERIFSDAIEQVIEEAFDDETISRIADDIESELEDRLDPYKDDSDDDD